MAGGEVAVARAPSRAQLPSCSNQSDRFVNKLLPFPISHWARRLQSKTRTEWGH